ncbi:hypothetical protein RHMOL_Rhmol10G0147000 [Rhododendron molle]|uniref:Uncharacterized protein n=1 Tax=Rhododendron molle TaxID=49168 RepID=A0ACC0M247_RHOML|nr:hypothetical protein RHMOL_Rhmol10G0147000 [Rhododendron molle]
MFWEDKEVKLLGDFGIDLNAEMGEQQREEAESREQPFPRRGPVTDLGKEPMATEMKVPIRLFSAGYLVDKAHHLLLNAIARAHPEMIAPFNPRSAQHGALFLGNHHEVLGLWAQLRFGDFTPNTEPALQEVTQDMEVLGFDQGWLCARSFALRAVGDRATLRPKIQGLAAQLESAWQHMANLEARFRQVMQRDGELAAAALNLEDPGLEELVFAEWLA